ncbi:hypothetical protein [Peribacillus butanolivorans]
MKKLVLYVLAMVVILSLVSPANNALATSQTDLSDYNVIQGESLVKDVEIDVNNIEYNVEEAFKKYGLEVIDIEAEIPKGTNVISFDNMEDFNKFMILTEDSEEVQIEEDIEEPSLIETEPPLLFARAAAASSTKTYTKSSTFGTSKVNLKAKITRDSKGKVTKSVVYTTHTGITFSLDWEERYAYSVLNTAKTGGTAYGGGTKKWVVFVSNLGTIRKQDLDLTLKF